jgi:hypothetical protein
LRAVRVLKITLFTLTTLPIALFFLQPIIVLWGLPYIAWDYNVSLKAAQAEFQR